MIRYIALLTATLLLTVSCSNGSDVETNQVPTLDATATRGKALNSIQGIVSVDTNVGTVEINQAN